MFKIFDLDGNGTLSKKELKVQFKKMPQLFGSIWEDLMEEADINKDNELDFNEFFSFMEKLSQL